jgi:hypothetical protein
MLAPTGIVSIVADERDQSFFLSDFYYKARVRQIHSLKSAKPSPSETGYFFFIAHLFGPIMMV